MAHYTFSADDPLKMRASEFVLDKYLAPKASNLTEFLVPEIEKPANYYGSFVINNMFVAEFQDEPRGLLLVFLRRVDQAVVDYRDARSAIAEWLRIFPETNTRFSIYLTALSRFEQAAMNAHLAVHSLHAVVDSGRAGRAFRKGENSPTERLSEVCNAVKHHFGNIKNEGMSGLSTPVWLVNEGLEYVKPSKGQRSECGLLLLAELADILTDLVNTARVVSVDYFDRSKHPEWKG